MSIMIQSIHIVLTLGIFAVLIWRILANAGVPFKKTIPEQVRSVAEAPTLQESAKVFGYTMLFRVFVLIAGLIIYCLFVETASQVQWGNFLENWIKWDAKHYISISEGYTALAETGDYTTLVFFPLYSVLLKLVRFVIPNAVVAGLLVSAVASSLACVFLYKLVCLDYSKTTAQTSVLLLCLFPFGFFYSAIMSASVFLLTSVTTLYYTRKHHWWVAGICGCFAALSRSIGVFLIFPAMIELLEETKLL